MRYLNLTVEDLTSPTFLGSTPVQRATWLCLMRYSAQHETGGTIEDCMYWGDRKWMQLCGVTKGEVEEESDLWGWDGHALMLAMYPIQQEVACQAMRKGGKQHGRGMPKKGPNSPPNKPSIKEVGSPAEDNLNPNPKDKGKGKEEEKEPKPPKPNPFKSWTEEEFRADVARANKDHKYLDDAEQEKFVLHYLEPDQNGKPKLHLEKTWGTAKRLNNWASRGYGNGNQRQSELSLEEARRMAP